VGPAALIRAFNASRTAPLHLLVQHGDAASAFAAIICMRGDTNAGDSNGGGGGVGGGGGGGGSGGGGAGANDDAPCGADAVRHKAQRLVVAMNAGTAAEDAFMLPHTVADAAGGSMRDRVDLAADLCLQHGRGLHSFTSELNLSNSRTRS